MAKRILLGISGALVSILFTAGLSDLFHLWELKTYDFRLQVRGKIKTDPALVIVDADDASMSTYGRWPWNRSIHAEMINFLKSQGAKVIAYDILFSQSSDPNEDLALSNAIKNADNLIFPVAVGLLDKGNGEDNELPLNNGILLSPAAEKFYVAGESIFPLHRLTMEVGALGHIAANRDADGMVRRVPLLVNYKGELLPSLAFQAVLDYLDVSSSDIEINRKNILLKKAQFSERDKTIDIQIPVDSRGQMLINYAGRWVETFKHTSFASVLLEGSSKQNEDLSGKFILVSNTLSGHDIKPVPIEKDYPGSGIHANIVNTILTQNFLKETHKSTTHSIILFLCLVTAIILSRRNYLLQAGLFLILTGGYFVINLCFFFSGWVVPLFIPIFSMVLTALIVLIYRASVEKNFSDELVEEKRQIESHLEAISGNLFRKEADLEKIRNLLKEMNIGIEQSRLKGEEQTQKITDLQSKLQLLVEDKERLQKERKKLEEQVLDLRVHISFDEVRMEGKLQKLQEECMQFGIITQNRATLETFRTIKQSAAVPSALLILGESGTGKELFAQALHQMSGRRQNRFIAINMAAVPDTLVESELFGHKKGSFTGAVSNKKGRFAEADKGTLFLDEIGDIGKDIQVKLLRVLQEKEIQPVGGSTTKVDVRIVAATNKDLEEEIKQTRFRDDLYYRLNTIMVTLPALRDRKEDIPILARYFMERYQVEYGKNIQGISDRAMTALVNYHWGGNIRELENVVQRGITLCETELIQEKDLGLDEGNLQAIKPLKMITAQEGDEMLLRVLRENGFEIKETANRLKMSRNTVANRFKGICFDLLVKNQLDREQVAREICVGSDDHDFVLQRITEYHENLIHTARRFDNEEEAIADAINRAKNLPVQYHSSVEELVRNDFFEREK